VQVPGRILLPLSRFLEKRYPHRAITHSFAATGVWALLTIPVALWFEAKYAGFNLGLFYGMVCRRIYKKAEWRHFILLQLDL